MYSLPAWLSGNQQSLGFPLFLAVSATLALNLPALASSSAPTASLLTAPASKIDSSKITKRPFPPTAIFQPAKANVYAGEFSIAGVTLSSTQEDVLWLLGQPKSRETLTGSFVDEILYYGGISISIAEGQVWDIIATSPKFCTPSGVCPGDSVSRVFNTLGPTDIIGQRAVYTASGMGSCVLDLGIDYDTVNQIKLICQ